MIIPILEQAGFSDIVVNPDNTVDATYNGYRYIGLYPKDVSTSEDKIFPTSKTCEVSVTFKFENLGDT